MLVVDALEAGLGMEVMAALVVVSDAETVVMLEEDVMKEGHKAEGQRAAVVKCEVAMRALPGTVAAGKVVAQPVVVVLLMGETEPEQTVVEVKAAAVMVEEVTVMERLEMVVAAWAMEMMEEEGSVAGAEEVAAEILRIPSDDTHFLVAAQT